MAQLFWDAFAGKLGRILAPEDKALSFLSGALRPDAALTVRDTSGRLLGVAGIKSDGPGLIAAGFAELAAAYGWLGALWRGPLLDLTSRNLDPGQMLLDGLFVAEDVRGKGVGTVLVRAVIAEAATRGLREVCLEVVDSNPGARQLYFREGFRIVREERLWLLRPVFGFRQSALMVRDVRA